MSRAFNKLLDFILCNIEKCKCFGGLKARVHSALFQKRVLPHFNLLHWLDEDDQPRCVDGRDKLISGNLPYPDTQPEFYKIVKSSTIHGPCGVLNQSALCTEDGECTKDYPKEFWERTVAIDDDFPLYRRHDSGLVLRARRGVLLKNAAWSRTTHTSHWSTAATSMWRSAPLSKRSSTCTSMFSRVQTGPVYGLRTRKRLSVRSNLDGRWVSPNEACWNIFGFKIRANLHSVVFLPVHLGGQETVYFNEGREAAELEQVLGGRE